MTNEFAYTAPPPLDIDFSPPLKAGNGELARLSLREPRAGELWLASQHLTARNGSKGSRMYQRALVAKVSGVPESVIDDLPMSAFTRAATYLQEFVEAGLVDPFGDDAEAPKSFTITLDPPITISNVAYPSITLTEPTLGQMAKAEASLGDGSEQRVRRFQEDIVALSAGGGSENTQLVSQLPISALNRAATFVMGFTSAGRAIST